MPRSRQQWRKRQAENAASATRAKHGRWTDPENLRNEKFDQYYKAQNIVSESEWPTFMSALQTTLPVCFRVNPLSASAEPVKERLERITTLSEFSASKENNDNQKQAEKPADQSGLMCADASVTHPFQLPWYPNGLAWQINATRSDLRKNLAAKAFHKWLVAQTTAGSISRQEAVSMVPPLLLEAQSHHDILDMCASPGSKTTQLLEALHGTCPAGQMPSGMVVANDNDSKRAYMLVHQCKRIGSHALLVTCHDAQRFPNVCKNVPGNTNSGMFDRVLCDVPCSGDGTLRKAPDLWRRWSPALGFGVHKLQTQIAMRGLQLLKIGGCMVYSTCTFNPIEDEAVVASVLSACEGAVEIVDCSDKLPGLKRRRGLSNWRVLDADMNEFSSYEEARNVAKETQNYFRAVNTKSKNPEEAEPDKPALLSKTAHKIIPTMFPPTAEQAKELQLEKCMRFLPHEANTGGFFVCLLRKVRALPKQKPSQEDPSSSEKDTNQSASDQDDDVTTPQEPANNMESQDSSNSSRARALETRVKGQDPKLRGRDALARMISAPETLAQEIKDFYGLSHGFPSHNMIVRDGCSKSVSVVSDAIASKCLAEHAVKHLNVVSAGLVTFVAPNPGKDGQRKAMENAEEASGNSSTGTAKKPPVYRISSEGVSLVAPFVTRRKLIVTSSDFAMMMRRIGDFVQFKQYSTELAGALESITYGCFIAELDTSISESRVLTEQESIDRASSQAASNHDVIAVSCWRGANRLNVMCSKDEAANILLTMIENKLTFPTEAERIQFALDDTSTHENTA